MRFLLGVLALSPVLAGAQLLDLRAIGRSHIRGLHFDGGTTEVGLSANGRFAVMATSDGTLIPDDLPRSEDVIVRDRVAKSFRRANVNADGSRLDVSEVGAVAVSNNGATVAFSCRDGVFVCTSAGTLRISDGGSTIRLASDGMRLFFYDQSAPKVWDASSGTASPISDYLRHADATFTGIVFSDSMELVTAHSNKPLDGGTTAGRFVIDVGTGRAARLVLPSTSGIVGLSRSGRYVSYLTDLSIDARDKGGQDVYRRDRLTGEDTLVSVDGTGQAVGNGSVSDVQMSESGQFFWYGRWARSLPSAMARMTPFLPSISRAISDMGDAIAGAVPGVGAFPFDRWGPADGVIFHARTGDTYGLTLGKQPGWSACQEHTSTRDGRSVFFQGYDERGRLKVWDQATGKVTGLLKTDNAGSLHCDATGQYVVFISGDDRYVGASRFSQAMLLDRVTGAVSLVSRDADGKPIAATHDSVTISPDGKWIAYTESRQVPEWPFRVPQAYLVRRGAGVAKPIASYANGELPFLSGGVGFSPDSRSVYFAADPWLAPGGEIYRPNWEDYRIHHQRLFRKDLQSGDLVGAPMQGLVRPEFDLEYSVYGGFEDSMKVYFTHSWPGADQMFVTVAWDLAAGTVTPIPWADDRVILDAYRGRLLISQTFYGGHPAVVFDVASDRMTTVQISDDFQARLLDHDKLVFRGGRHLYTGRYEFLTQP